MKLFAVDEWATLGHLITDYEWLWYHVGRLEQQIALLDLELEKTRAVAKAHESHAEKAQTGATRLAGLLDTEQAIRQETLSRAAVELWLWRGAAVLAFGAAVAFGTLYFVGR